MSGPGVLAPPRTGLSRDALVVWTGVALLVVWLTVTVALPLGTLFLKSLQGPDGGFVGLANYAAYISTPSLLQSVWNSVFVAGLTTLITVPLAFVYAYALTRSCMPAKGLFQALALIPILVPSLLPAISLIYLFGNQGLLRSLMFGAKIYGAGGIVAAEIFYVWPSAVIILIASLATADARLYEAAGALGASRRRIFATVTLPGARYGLVSAAFVTFTLAITDFGIPKVLGGRFNVLATDIYQQVVGQQNFRMGAVTGVVLLLPAALAFAADRFVRRRQAATLTARAVPLVPAPHRRRDGLLLAYCGIVGGLLLAILLVAAWASLIRYWPYDLSLTLANYRFASFDAAGWSAYGNSVRLALWTACIGTLIVFPGAYLIEKGRRFALGRAAAQLLATLPLGVPGLVLGISYIFFFNEPANPLSVIYGTMAILVVNSVTHFYTVGHLTATTTLKQIDPEFETVSASLKVPIDRTFFRVALPISLPAVLDIWIYLFVNALTTVSAVIFLYTSGTKPASVAVVNMDEAGFTAAAAAMAVLIAATAAAALGLQLLLRGRLSRMQRWRGNPAGARA